MEEEDGGANASSNVKSKQQRAADTKAVNAQATAQALAEREGKRAATRARVARERAAHFASGLGEDAPEVLEDYRGDCEEAVEKHERENLG
jgi:hypothetical protein